jgi:hypothetical protein
MSCALCFADHAEAVTCEAYAFPPTIADVVISSEEVDDSMLRGSDDDLQDPGIVPGAAVRGVWGQGCGESQGVIVSVGIERVTRSSYGFAVTEKIKRMCVVCWEDGHESRDDFCVTDTLKNHYANHTGVGVYLEGFLVAGWESQTKAWKSHRADVKACAEAHMVKVKAARVAQCLAWDAEHADAKRMPYGNRSGELARFQPIPGGVRIWCKDVAREIKIGEVIRYGGYNFDYTGTLVKVTAGMIVYNDHGQEKRLRADKFVKENLEFDLEHSNRQRAAWSD